MKVNVYALYSPYVECYDLPITSGMDEKDYVESYRRLIKQQTDHAYGAYLHEKKLCKIGVYDDVTGMIVGQPPVVLADLASFFPAGYLAKKQSDTVNYFKGAAFDGKTEVN